MSPEYTLPEGDCITLINANVLKGLPVFIDMAKRFPNKKFLGVRPYYSKIQVPEDIRNIEWIDIQDDIRNVLKRTKILLVPSVYESWGRVAFEAMYNGIPVLYSKPLPQSRYITGSTEGMAAWIGDNGIPCSLTTPDEWIEGLQKLEDEDVYNEYSKKAWDTSHSLGIENEIQMTEQLFMEYAAKYAGVKKTKGEEIQQGPSRLIGNIGAMRRPVQLSVLRRPGPTPVPYRAQAQAAPPQQSPPPQAPQRRTMLPSSLVSQPGRFGTRR